MILLIPLSLFLLGLVGSVLAEYAAAHDWAQAMARVARQPHE